MDKDRYRTMKCRFRSAAIVEDKFYFSIDEYGFLFIYDTRQKMICEAIALPVHLQDYHYVHTIRYENNLYVIPGTCNTDILKFNLISRTWKIIPYRDLELVGYTDGDFLFYKHYLLIFGAVQITRIDLNTDVVVSLDKWYKTAVEGCECKDQSPIITGILYGDRILAGCTEQDAFLMIDPETGEAEKINTSSGINGFVAVSVLNNHIWAQSRHGADLVEFDDHFRKINSFQLINAEDENVKSPDGCVVYRGFVQMNRKFYFFPWGSGEKGRIVRFDPESGEQVFIGSEAANSGRCFFDYLIDGSILALMDGENGCSLVNISDGEKNLPLTVPRRIVLQLLSSEKGKVMQEGLYDLSTFLDIVSEGR